MKIKTKEVQIREKIEQVNSAITYASDELKYAQDRLRAKESWSILSFVSGNYLALTYDIKHRTIQLSLLKEYRDTLSEQL